MEAEAAASSEQQQQQQQQQVRVRPRLRVSSESDSGAAVDEAGGGGRTSNDDINSSMMTLSVPGVGVGVGLNNNNNNNNMSKAARLPRWTRQEILVLIEGKRVAESRVRRGRVVGLGSSSSVEPKWATVSSYCKRHGVNRGPVQCRKRWSNLAGDFKKIKDWEARRRHGGDSESYWVMRNDLRRERRLPGFFDREVYDILDNPISVSPIQQPQPHTHTVTPQQQQQQQQGQEALNNNEEEEEEDDDDGDDDEVRLSLTLADDNNSSADSEDEDSAQAVDVVFDSGRTAAADHALFSPSPFQFPKQDKDVQDNPIPTTNPSPPSAIPLNMAPSPLSAGMISY